jgi:hypothetical protein
MAKLAQEGKIIQGMFVGRKKGKKNVQSEMWEGHWSKKFAHEQARHFRQNSLQ